MGTNTRKRKQKLHKGYIAGMIFAAAILCIAVAMLLLSLFGILPPRDRDKSDGFVERLDMKQEEYEQLGYDLELQGVGLYAGLFFEDGSNDSVSNVLMIKIKNTGDKDLQLARLSLSYSDFTAEFELTNLPAGRTMIVLEKNRHVYPDEKYLSVALTDVVRFSENMDVNSDRFQISGLDGIINLQNCSDADISEDVYIYYKYVADDMLYGGITFRAKIVGGMAAGETKQVASSHFDPQRCIVLAVREGA